MKRLALATCVALYTDPLAAEEISRDVLESLLPPAMDGWSVHAAPQVEELMAVPGSTIAALDYRSETDRFLLVISHDGPMIDLWADGFASAPEPNPASVRSQFYGHPMQREADMITLLVGETLLQAAGDNDISAVIPYLEALDLDTIAALGTQ